MRCMCVYSNLNSHMFEDPCFMAYSMILLGKWPVGVGKNVRSVVLKVVKMSLRLNRWVMRKRILIDFTSTQAVSYRVGSGEIFHKKCSLFSFFSIPPLWELSVSRGRLDVWRHGLDFCSWRADLCHREGAILSFSDPRPAVCFLLSQLSFAGHWPFSCLFLLRSGFY